MGADHSFSSRKKETRYVYQAALETESQSVGQEALGATPREERGEENQAERRPDCHAVAAQAGLPVVPGPGPPADLAPT